MPKSPTRRFASRMSGLRIVIACLLTLVAPTRLPADEPSTTEATRAIADSARAAEKVEAAPRRRIEVSVQLVELDKALIADDESKLWKLVPWAKVEVRYVYSDWNNYYSGPGMWPTLGPQIDPSHYHKLSDVIRGQVQQGKALMSFTIPQKDAVGFVTDALAHKQGRLIQESTNAADEGSPVSFRLAHHPLAVRHATFALRPNSHISRKFSVAPRSFREGIHLAAFSEVAVTTPVKTGWPWLDKQIPPSREMVSGSARLTELVPRGQALVVFSLGSGDEDMEPGKPSLLVIVPKEIDAVAMPAAAVKIGDAAAQPAPPTERLGYGSSVAPPTGVSPATEATPTSQPELEAASRRVTPTVATEPQQNRPRRRDRPELKALHDDVRGLRDDVRRLSELLEKRLATKDLPRRVPGDSEVLPQADTRGKLEAPVPPNALLYFTATWCGPCQKMQPLVNRIVRDGGSIQTIDIDKDAALTKRFNVLSIPCFIRLEEGNEVKRVTGMDSERRLRELATFPIHQRLLKALNQEIELNFNDTPLREVVRVISKKIGANFAVDSRSLDEEGIKVTTPVSIVVSGLSARSALRLILEPLHLTYVVEDEVIMIVSRQRAKGELIVTTYAVADLLATEPAVAEKTDAEQIESGLKQIIEVIQSTVSPDSWDAAGGPGSVRSYATTRSLVVRQTRDVHAEIAKLLEQIRRLKRLPGRVSSAVGQPLIVKTYAVADLVVPIPGEPGDRTTPRTSDWLKLVDHITTTVEPQNWTADGGPCSIKTYEKSLSLVIRATSEMHEATANLLDALRREQHVQVSAQVRWVKFDDDTELKKAGLELNFDTATRSMKLDAKAAETFIAACGKQGKFAPKLTMFNGQIGTIQTEDPIGVRLKLHLRGVVTPDRRSVCLGVALNPDSLVNELVRQSNNMSDGEYLLLDMTEQSYRDKSEKPKGRMLVLVQSRIIIPEEEERLGFPKAEGAERSLPVK